MKIDNIKKIVKKSKTIIIYDRKWISNGECITKIPERVFINSSNVFNILSIDEGQEDKYQVGEVEVTPVWFDGDDYKGETLLAVVPFLVYYRGVDYIIFCDENKCYFADVSYIKAMELRSARYVLRGDMVAVFDGMIFCGCIAPCDMGASKLGGVFSSLAERMRRTETDDGQIEFEEDEDDVSQ